MGKKKQATCEVSLSNSTVISEADEEAAVVLSLNSRGRGILKTTIKGEEDKWTDNPSEWVSIAPRGQLREKRETMRQFTEDSEVLSLLDRVHQGYTRPRGEKPGRMTEDAKAAQREIQVKLDATTFVEQCPTVTTEELLAMKPKKTILTLLGTRTYIGQDEFEIEEAIEDWAEEQGVIVTDAEAYAEEWYADNFDDDKDERGVYERAQERHAEKEYQAEVKRELDTIRVAREELTARNDVFFVCVGPYHEGWAKRRIAIAKEIGGKYDSEARAFVFETLDQAKDFARRAPGVENREDLTPRFSDEQHKEADRLYVAQEIASGMHPVVVPEYHPAYNQIRHNVGGGEYNPRTRTFLFKTAEQAEAFKKQAGLGTGRALTMTIIGSLMVIGFILYMAIG